MHIMDWIRKVKEWIIVRNDCADCISVFESEAGKE